MDLNWNKEDKICEKSEIENDKLKEKLRSQNWYRESANSNELMSLFKSNKVIQKLCG